MQELGEKMARLLMGEDVDEDVQFLGQFWCDRAEIWMVEDVDEDVQFLGQFWCDRAEIWMVDSVWDSALA